MRRNRFLVFGFVVAASLSRGQELPSIHVTILNEKDELVRDAVAEALPQDRLLKGPLSSCKSAEDGTCIIKVGDYGKFGVIASKVEDGYPQQHFSFFAVQNPKPPLVVLSPQQPIQSVTVHLGKKAGVLIGTVADAITGKQLNANVTFRLLSDPSNFLSGSGLTNAKFRILVPSGTPITMVVSQEGYEDWTYSLGRSEFRNAILLKAGEELTLDIRLQPKS